MDHISVPQHYSRIFDIKYMNYLDRARSSPSTDNLFGVRYYSYTNEPGGFPLHALTISYPPNFADDWCGLLTFGTRKCPGYIFMRGPRSSSPYSILYSIYYGRYPGCPVTTCHASYYQCMCLFPKSEYNRELSNEAPYGVFPMQLLTEFEGNSPEAVANRERRVEFFDNLGNKYWVKCDHSCKLIVVFPLKLLFRQNL